jgi:hypothetical protein
VRVELVLLADLRQRALTQLVLLFGSDHRRSPPVRDVPSPS